MGAASSSPARAALAEEALAVARGAHPRISIDDAVFLSHLDRHLPADADRAIVAGWHVADLYLACASGRGDRVACAELDRAHLSRVPAMLSRLRDAGPIVDDVRQLVAEKLLVPDGDMEPKILGYSGEAPLSAWLRVVVVRAAIGVLRKKSHASGGEHDDEIDGIARAADTELDYVRLRYRAEFDRALRDAFARLDVRARNVLRLHLVDGLGIDGVGEAYGVHRATSARWIAAARAEVLDETRRLLTERLHLAPAELDSLVRAMRSGIDVSIRGLIVG